MTYCTQKEPFVVRRVISQHITEAHALNFLAVMFCPGSLLPAAEQCSRVYGLYTLTKKDTKSSPWLLPLDLRTERRPRSWRGCRSPRCPQTQPGTSWRWWGRSPPCTAQSGHEVWGASRSSGPWTRAGQPAQTGHTFINTSGFFYRSDKEKTGPPVWSAASVTWIWPYCHYRNKEKRLRRQRGECDLWVCLPVSRAESWCNSLLTWRPPRWLWGSRRRPLGPDRAGR